MCYIIILLFWSLHNMHLYHLGSWRRWKWWQQSQQRKQVQIHHTFFICIWHPERWEWVPGHWVSGVCAPTLPPPRLFHCYSRVGIFHQDFVIILSFFRWSVKITDRKVLLVELHLHGKGHCKGTYAHCYYYEIDINKILPTTTIYMTGEIG